MMEQQSFSEWNAAEERLQQALAHLESARGVKATDLAADKTIEAERALIAIEPRTPMQALRRLEIGLGLHTTGDLSPLNSVDVLALMKDAKRLCASAETAF